MSSCASHLYVYYRAASTHTPAIMAGVSKLHEALRAEHCARCELMQRVDTPGGSITWMECYLELTSSFSDAYAQALAEAEFLSSIDGLRHSEYFTKCLPSI